MTGLRLFFYLWTRASAVTGLLWALLYGGGSKFAEAGLITMLVLLLTGGAVLLFWGVRDAVRDFRRFLHGRNSG